MPVDRSSGSLTGLRPRSQTLYISQNRTVLSMTPDGAVAPSPHVGLFVRNTRMLSLYRHLVNGEPPDPVASSPVEQNSWLGYYIAPPPGVADVAQHSIEMRLSRFAGDGFHEDIDVTNFSGERVSLTLTIEVDADFADIEETAGPREQHGVVARGARRDVDGCELTLDYHAEHAYRRDGAAGVARFDAQVSVHARSKEAEPSGDARRIDFRIELAPRASWHACVDVEVAILGQRLPLVARCGTFFGTHSARDVARGTYQHDATRFTTESADPLAGSVIACVAQAAKDLAALRLDDADHGERAFTVSAGLPAYVGLFGRDPLAAGAQGAMLTTGILRGTLVELPRWQGRKVDRFRDEQPGRMLHQARGGPLATLEYNPFGRSYASVTSTMFYPAAVSELWHWTGNRDLVAPLIEPAMEAMRWIDEHGDIDGDGFYEYMPMSDASLQNQGWKDSGDAIVHADGGLVRPPIGTCEMQGFVYLSKLRLAELLAWFGRKAESLRLLREASALKHRFNEVFWMPEVRYFAMGIGPDKHIIRSIASDPGLCLSTGIVDERHARATAERLFEADMFSGWGVRTLSSDHPAFDPYSYHRGSVWPVDQGALALGLARYGLHGHVSLLARALFDAARLFEHQRLPECWAGHPRDPDHPFPALYPRANWPQAWSASSVFAVLQALLGVYPFAPLGLLLVDPRLPDWLPSITLSNLHVGEAVVSLRFQRKDDGDTRMDVLDRRGSLRIVRQPSPWSVTAGPVERVRDLLSSARA